VSSTTGKFTDSRGVYEIAKRTVVRNFKKYSPLHHFHIISLVGTIGFEKWQVLW